MHGGVSWSWETLQKFPALLPALPLRPVPLLCYIHSQLYGKMKTCLAISNFTQADLERFSSGSSSSAVFLSVLPSAVTETQVISSTREVWRWLLPPTAASCQQGDLEGLGASPIKTSVDHSCQHLPPRLE